MMHKKTIKSAPLELKVIDSSRVTIIKMLSNQFEGWVIKLDGIRCGYIKFISQVDKISNRHVTIDIHISKPKRAIHIGRIALKLAIESSEHTHFVAHLRKNNVPSAKVLAFIGFKINDSYLGKQLCMSFKKELIK